MLFCTLCAAPAAAQEQWWTSSNPLGIDVHGFVSQGFLVSTDNNFLAKSERGSFEFTEVGLNVTKNLTDQLRVGMQLFTRHLGPSGSYTPKFDWYYLDYRFRDWLGIRAGRTKIPFGLYNEVNDIDSARVPVLLPQSLYPNHHRDILLAQTGGEIYGNLSIGPPGRLEYRAYGGTIFLDTPRSPNPNATIREVSVPYLAGGRLMWWTPVEGLQVGGSAQVLRLDTDYAFTPAFRDALVALNLVPMDYSGLISVDIKFTLWVASLEYTFQDLQLAAEYGRWYGDVQSSVATVIPNSKNTNERFYGMASYHVTSWLTPGVYYSSYYVDTDDRKGREAYQHDLAGTLRFDLMPYWLLKLEGHFMRGTAMLDPALNGDQPLTELRRKWGLFLIKTTAYF